MWKYGYGQQVFGQLSRPQYYAYVAHQKSYGRPWCSGDLNACGASGCSVFAKRQTTEEKRTTIGESNIVEMSYREDGLDPFNRAFVRPSSGRASGVGRRVEPICGCLDT
jgi:hypothetical protein